MASQQTLSAAFRVYFQPSDGEDGQPAYVLALSNEVEMVPCDGLGNVSDVSAIEGTTWTFYAGSTALDVSGYSYTVRAVGCSVSYDADGTTGTITVGAMTDDTATVSVIVTYNDTTYTRTYTLTKNYAGLSYSIVATPTVLKADSSGKLTDYFLYYAVRVYDNGTVTTYTDLATSGEAYTKYGLYLYYAYAGASSRIRLTGGGTFTFGSDIITNAYANGGLTLYLYQGGDYSTGTLVDQEDIEVVKDGVDGNDGDTGDTGEPAYTLDLDNECETVACDSDGTVTGTIQGSHFYFYVGSEEATFGGGCTYTYEETGCTATVSHSGTEGTIVIDNLTDDTGTVAVTVTYGSSVSRTKTYTVTKVYAGADGSSPTVYSLCVSPAAIKNRTTTELTVSILCTTGSSVSEATFASGFWGSGYYCYWRLVNGDDYGSYTAITSNTASLVTGTSEYTAFLACDSVEVSLWKGTYSEGTRVDVETIPCVDDGEQGDNGNDGTSINVAGEVDAYCPDWSTFSSYIDAEARTDVVIACGEYGTIVGGSATATGPYLYTFDSNTEFTSATATVGNCYTVKDGDYAGHIICAVESGWVDLGALTAETVEYMELKDGSYVSSSYASSATAVISDVDQSDGSLTFGLAYDLYVCLAHVVGTTTSYATGATVTAEIMTASGTSTVTLTALTEAPYVYAYTGTETGVEEDTIPSKIVVTAEYEDETYTYSIPVTVGVKSYLSAQEELYACIYMSDGSTSTLLQTVAAISATVTARNNLLTGLGNGNGWTNRGGVSTNVLCDANGSVMGLCYTSDESPDYLYSPQIYLACGQTYTLSIYHSGTGRISLRYATEQGETAYALFSAGTYLSLSWSGTGETLTFRDGSGTDYDGATYTRYSATFEAPVTGWYVFRDATSSYYWLVCPQLEVGDTVSAWNMGDTTTEGAISVTANEITSSVSSTLEGYVTSSQLTQTADTITAAVESDYSSAGLTITDDTIVLNAEKVYVTNDGETAVALFEDGKISADYIDAEEVVTDYFEAENAVIEDLTIEGNITYKTTIINKGNYADYFHDVIPYGLSTSYPCLDVCSLSGPVVLDAPLQNVIGNNICLPFVYGSSGNVSSYVRGVTTYNASISRSMTWEDFRRCIGKEIILTNHTGSQVNVYCYGYVDEDGTFMAYSSGFLTINNGYSASFLLRYLSCGFVWEVRHATSFVGIEQGLRWDVPEGAVAYQDYQWSGSSRVSATGYMATGLLTVPEGTQHVQLEVLSDGDNLLAFDGVYIGTTTSLGTTLLDSTTEDCSVKRYDDSYAYAVGFDVDESAAHYLAVNVAVYDGTSGTPGDLVTVSDTDVDIDNLKILFY